MKKKIIIMTLIIMLLFTACSNQNNSNSSQNSDIFADGYGVVSTEKESSTKNNSITHTNIEKVILSYLDITEEITEEQQSFDFIEEIENCDTIPSTTLTTKIGTMKIKYVDKDEPTDFAVLYLGSDGYVYAKYIKNQDFEYAYKVN